MKSLVTICIDSNLLRKVKLIATREGLSVSAIVQRELIALVRERQGAKNKSMSYEESRRHALALLKEGWNLGGKRPASRDELHER